MEHTNDCIEAGKRYEENVAKWEKLHPKYCKHCSGWGAFWSSYDPSPAGISLGSGSMIDVEPCPKCVEEDMCPWCRGNLSENADTGELSCTECDWNDKEENADGLPEPPECYCCEQDIEDLLS